MPKFSSVGLEKGKSVVIEKQNQNEPKGNDQQACELSMDAKELTPVSKVFGTEEDIGLSNISEVLSAFDNESATVGQLVSSSVAEQISLVPTLPATQELVDLSKDSEDFTSEKRQSPTEQANAELDVPLKFLKKKIKIEKD